MGLPFRRQPLGDFIQVHELTHRQVARAIGASDPARVNNLIAGRSYPTAAEIEALERLMKLPIQVMFDPEVLKYFNPDGSIHSAARRAEGRDQ